MPKPQLIEGFQKLWGLWVKTTAGVTKLVNWPNADSTTSTPIPWVETRSTCNLVWLGTKGIGRILLAEDAFDFNETSVFQALHLLGAGFYQKSCKSVPLHCKVREKEESSLTSSSMIVLTRKKLSCWSLGHSNRHSNLILVAKISFHPVAPPMEGGVGRVGGGRAQGRESGQTMITNMSSHSQSFSSRRANLPTM